MQLQLHLGYFLGANRPGNQSPSESRNQVRTSSATVLQIDGRLSCGSHQLLYTWASRMDQTPTPETPIITTRRIEAFSDGVFAIAITLLVLGIAVPDSPASQLQPGQLYRHLLDLWPKIASYIISFGIVGIFWFGHHVMFHYIRRADRLLVWLNTLFLMTIAFFPFPAGLIGTYTRQPEAIIVYGGSLVLMGLALYGIWAYASTGHRLIDPQLDPKFIALAKWYMLGGSLVYVAAIFISFVQPYLSLGIFLIVPLLYLLPSPIDRYTGPVRAR